MSSRKELPEGRIRRYDETKDLRIVRYLIGSRILNQKGIANKKEFWNNKLVYIWIIIITLWILKKIINDSNSKKIVIILIIKALPIILTPFIILLAFINWFNSNYFRNFLEKTFHNLNQEKNQLNLNFKEKEKDDDNDCCWILEYDSRQLGVICLDNFPVSSRSSQDSKESNSTSIEESKESPKESSTKSSTKSSSKESTKESTKESKDKKEKEDNEDFQQDTIEIKYLATAPDFKSLNLEIDLIQHIIINIKQKKNNNNNNKIKRLSIKIQPELELNLIKSLKNFGFYYHHTNTNTRMKVNPNSWLIKYKFLFKFLLGVNGNGNFVDPWPLQTWVFDLDLNNSSCKFVY